MLNLDETINFWDNMNQETEEHIYNVIEVLKDYVESKEYIHIDYSDLAVLILKIIENNAFAYDIDDVIGKINDLRQY
jgi:hypothetical protein